MRTFFLFTVVTLLALGLMYAASILALPLAFDTQGSGWTAAPFRSLVVMAGALLLFPASLVNAITGDQSAPGIAAFIVLSVVYGAVAVAIHWLWRRDGQGRMERGKPV